MSRKAIRCAIYTRKSSEEGLEQEFNSLDAQREAGEAYVKSQAHEGWKALPALYDDGGFSGGTMERPALKRLLEDVDQGLIDVVVVYKIDRLTRSLPDFARIVERFDAQEVSFVSVTQSFNTTSSMGRLTLNVLLSFAQFEREVTGERIRDKIAASKAKGMWMGGNLPLGYDAPDTDARVLKVNEADAKTVRHIFERYLELGSVHALMRELKRDGITSKRRKTGKGKETGGKPIGRGPLFHILRNPIYLGRIRHKDELYDGAHQAIIDQDLFDRVQQSLDQHKPKHRASYKADASKAPFLGKIFDAQGEVMSPVFTRNRHGKIYRYYATATLLNGSQPSTDDGILRRISAPDLERTVSRLLSQWLPRDKESLKRLQRIEAHSDGLLIDLEGSCQKELALNLGGDTNILHQDRRSIRLRVPMQLPLRGGKRLVLAGQGQAARIDPSLIAALRKAHQMITWRKGRPSIDRSPKSPYDRKILRLALLAPDLQADILAGRQPPTLSLEALKTTVIPLDWNAQREALGWHVSTHQSL